MSVASLVVRLLPPLWRRWLVAVGVLALLLLVGAHVWQAYQQRVDTYRHQVETALRAVSQLQATNIADWRVRHLGDAADLSSDPLLMHAVARWLAEAGMGGDSGSRGWAVEVARRQGWVHHDQHEPQGQA